MPIAAIGAAIAGFAGTAGGAATIASVAGLGGALISSNATSKAAKAAQNAANQSAQLQQQQYDQTRADNAPFHQAGVNAVDAAQQRFGLTPSAPTTDWAKYVQSNPDALDNWNAIQGTPEAAQFGGDMAKFGQYHYQQDGSRRDISQFQTANPNAQPLQTPERPTTAARPDLPAPTSYATPEYTPTAGYQAPGLAPQVGYTAPALGAQVGYNAPAVSQAPGYTAPALGAAPDLARPDAGNLDVSLGAYQASPDLQYQIDQANRNTDASLGAKGGLQSGAELKALQKNAINLSLADYNRWKSDTTSQFNTNRSTTNANYEADRNSANALYQYAGNYGQSNAQFGANLNNSQWQTTNALNQSNAQFGSNLAANQRTSDNALNQSSAQFGANLAAGQRTSDNALTSQNAQFGYNATAADNQNRNVFNQSNSQFGANLANNQQQFSTGLTQANYGADRAYQDQAFTSDRAYDANRYDTQTNNILALAGYGQNANAQNQAAGANYANNTSNILTSNAATQGNAAMAGAGQVNNLISNGTNALAYYYGNRAPANSNAPTTAALPGWGDVGGYTAPVTSAMYPRG